MPFIGEAVDLTSKLEGTQMIVIASFKVVHTVGSGGATAGTLKYYSWHFSEILSGDVELFAPRHHLLPQEPFGDNFCLRGGAKRNGLLKFELEGE